MRGVIAEPLVQFAALGAVLFLISWSVEPEPNAARRIRVDAARRRELATMFEERHKRTPDATEMGEMIERWVHSELLFREGVALDLTRSDNTIREMVISKARAVIQSQVAAFEPTEAELQAFYQAARHDYDQPETLGLSQILISADETQALRLAQQVQRALQAGDPVDRPMMDQPPRPRRHYDVVFGPEFADALFELPDDDWHLIRSRRGYHVVKVRERRAPMVTELSQVRERVLLDWRNAQKQEGYHRAVDALLRDKYEVQIAEPREQRSGSEQERRLSAKAVLGQ